MSSLELWLFRTEKAMPFASDIKNLTEKSLTLKEALESEFLD